MTPAEKAQELYEQHKEIVHLQQGVLPGMDIGKSTISAALLTAKTTLSATTDSTFWEQVIEEIEKFKNKLYP